METQEFKYRLYVIRGPITILVALLIVVCGVYLVSLRKALVPSSSLEETALGEKIRTGEASIPLFTKATKAKLDKGPIFHALVSYTDRGFEPTVVTIKRGETVRFTNNSSNDVWIAAGGENIQIYPRTQEVCGSSDLDSCEPFAPQDFWQFKFNVVGEWEVVNNLDKSKSGKVVVR